MKTTNINLKEFRFNSINFQNKSMDNSQTKNAINFKGHIPKTDNHIIDGVLNNKFTQKILKLASSNPHAFNLCTMAIIAIFLRPVSILILPGAKKEDKQYAAGKSVISSIITLVTQISLCIPLAKTIEKIAKEAQIKPKTNFPKFKTPKFEVFNYFVNNGFAVILTTISSVIMAQAVTKIMNKLLPNNSTPHENKQKDGVK